MIGNTFDKKTVEFKHARKVWREIRQVYPGGGTVANISDFVSEGIIKSGLPVKLDMSANTITVYTEEQVKKAGEYKVGNSGDKWPELSTLGINGYLQEDIVVADANTIGTGTVVYDGAIYEYMFDADAAAKLKGLASVPMIVWVQ